MGSFKATLTRERLVPKPDMVRIAEVLMDDEEMEEYTIEVDVEYEVDGHYERDEYPDVSVIRATDSETNEEIRLTTIERTLLDQKASQYAYDECREREVDAAELRWEALREEGKA